MPDWVVDLVSDSLAAFFAVYVIDLSGGLQMLD